MNSAGGAPPQPGKARFQPSKALGSSSKTAGSKAGPDSVLPGGKAFETTAGIGAAAGNKPAAVQVFHNGKIVTPMPLQYRPKAKPEAGIEESKAGTIPYAMRKPKAVDAEDAEAENIKGKSTSKMAQRQMNMASSIIKKSVEENVVVTLSETDTSSCFFLPSFVIATDAKDLAIHDGRTSKYNAVAEAHKNGDNFVTNTSQTFNRSLKSQNEATAPTSQSEGGCQATSYEIDEACGTATGAGDEVLAVNEVDAEDPAGLTVLVRQFVTDTVNVALITPGCTLDPSDLSRPLQPGEREGGKKKKKNVPGTSAVSTTGQSSVNTGQGTGSGVGIQESKVMGGESNVQGSQPSQPQQGESKVDRGDGPSYAVDDDAAAGEKQVEPEVLSEADSEAILFARRAERIIGSDSLLKRLQMMERAVQQNAFMRQQLDYRDLPDVTPLVLAGKNSAQHHDNNAGGFGGRGMGIGLGAAHGMGGLTQGSVGSIEESLASEVESDFRGPDGQIKRLFSYLNHDLIRGRAVTCMVWNKVNQDLLAVGYGKLDTIIDPYTPGEMLDEPLHGGLVLFWSLRNPEYPEKVLKTPSPVTALEFSRLSPMILAVGCLSGEVCVYDVKRETDWGKPLESSAGIPGGHGDPVWQVKWVPRGTERLETLVTVSSDGKVLQWTIKKGLLVQCLMRLARSGQSDGWISRQAAGLSFDFCPDDPTCYVVGTEDGTLHRCSVSYTEQYLETYAPHHGPVYRVKFSPRWPQLFLTCSADWSLGLFHLRHKEPLFNVRAAGVDVAVADAAWCPDNSTIFAAVTQDGKLQLWDLSQSRVDPILTIDTTGDELPPKSRAKKAEDLPDAAKVPDKGLPPAPVFPMRKRDKEEEVKEGRVARLIKNLVQESRAEAMPRRVLTCVQFSERAPVIVVGDNKGAVTAYRVLDPPLITHMGPIQQSERCKVAIFSLCDPATLTKLKEDEQSSAASGGLPGPHVEKGEQNGKAAHFSGVQM